MNDETSDTNKSIRYETKFTIFRNNSNGSTLSEWREILGLDTLGIFLNLGLDILGILGL